MRADIQSGLVEKISFNDGQTQGIAQNGVSFVNGKVGLAARFDGIDDYIDLGSVYGVGSGDLTISFWAKFDAKSGDNQILSTGTTADPNYLAVTFNNNSSSKLRLVTYDGVYDNFYSGSTLLDEHWYHISIVRTGNVGYFYLDGVLNSTGDVRGGDLGLGALHLGRGHQLALFEGAIDELYIHRRALSQDEVRLLAD